MVICFVNAWNAGSADNIFFSSPEPKAQGELL